MTAEEFKSEVLPLGDKLFRYAVKFLEDRNEAQDAIQEIFIKLWSMKDRLKEYRSVEAFAMTMTRNYSIDQLRKRRKVIELDSISDSQITQDPQNSAGIKDTTDHVKRIIKLLPDSQQEVIHLRDIEGLEFDEIAEITLMTVNNVRVNLSRARNAVRVSIIKLEQHGLE